MNRVDCEETPPSHRLHCPKGSSKLLQNVGPGRDFRREIDLKSVEKAGDPVLPSYGSIFITLSAEELSSLYLVSLDLGCGVADH